MKKAIIVLLVVIVLISIALMWRVSDYNGERERNENLFENKITGDVAKNPENTSKSISGGAVSGSGSFGNSVEDSGLPDDLYKKPCGYYFLEYKVCAGVCPEGECLVDDESCYCQEAINETQN